MFYLKLISALAGIIPSFSTFIYFLYITDHLSYAERTLLPLKDRVYGYISTISLSIIAFVFLILFSALSYTVNLSQFLIIILMTINMILLFILMSYMTFHHPINTFITIYGSKFQLLNRLDSTHISARPSDGAKDDKAIVIFTISDLEKYILREEYSSNKPKSENFVVSLLFGIMCSLSSSIIIIAFAPNFNVYVNGIISFLVGALAGGFMYCKKLKENKKIERKPEEKESLKKKSKVNDYSKISVMIIMLSIIVIGVIYSVYSDWSVLIENPLTGSGKICKDLIPLASIVFGYYLGKDSKD